ncbi:MAG: hypothetical protein QNL62_08200 [Gammaproteobacteria bacterium]|nr:hypothetical protein [Gammaproteobacteria bacterium]
MERVSIAIKPADTQITLIIWLTLIEIDQIVPQYYFYGISKLVVIRDILNRETALHNVNSIQVQVFQRKGD